MNEKQIAKVLIEELLKLGFVVHRYNAVTTNSIYLKLDFGVCCGIRIADHSGKKKYHYRFNVVKIMTEIRLFILKILSLSFILMMNCHNY